MEYLSLLFKEKQHVISMHPQIHVQDATRDTFCAYDAASNSNMGERVPACACCCNTWPVLTVDSLQPATVNACLFTGLCLSVCLSGFNALT